MKFLVLLPAFLLAGCAAGHGSWLDNVGRLPNPPVEMTADEARSLTVEATNLRARADAIRAQMALERDRIERFRQYSALRRIGDQLAPIERRLWGAGRPARPAIL